METIVPPGVKVSAPMFSKNLPVTIIIPMLNEARTLPELLGALSGQAAKSDEIIFVDAGSDDGGPQLIKDWWEKNRWPGGSCKIFVRAGSLPGAGRNQGFREARNPWIAFLDAGMIPYPCWLESLMFTAKTNESGYAYGSCRFFADSPFGQAVCALTYGAGRVINYAVAGSIFHRAVFEKIGPFSPNLRWGEDLIWRKRFIEKIGLPLFWSEQAITLYKYFPRSLPGLFRKWIDSSSVLAAHGLRPRVAVFHWVVLLFFMGCLARGDWFLLGICLSAHFVGRGIIDPIRRSKVWNWWEGTPLAFFWAPPAAVVIDTASVLGSIFGGAGYCVARLRRTTG